MKILCIIHAFKETAYGLTDDSIYEAYIRIEYIWYLPGKI